MRHSDLTPQRSVDELYTIIIELAFERPRPAAGFRPGELGAESRFQAGLHRAQAHEFATRRSGSVIFARERSPKESQVAPINPTFSLPDPLRIRILAGLA